MLSVSWRGRFAGPLLLLASAPCIEAVAKAEEESAPLDEIRTGAIRRFPPFPAFRTGGWCTAAAAGAGAAPDEDAVENGNCLDADPPAAEPTVEPDVIAAAGCGRAAPAVLDLTGKTLTG